MKIVSLRINRPRSRYIDFWTRREIDLHLARDVFAELRLDLQHVIQIAVVIFRPKMGLVTDPDQLRTDPGLALLPANTAFEDVANAQFAPNFADSLAGMFVGHRRGTGDYA